MRNQTATPVIAKLSFGLVVLAGPAFAQISATSPFLPANAVIASNTPVEATTIELHGVVPTPNGPLFSIYNVSRKASTLVGLNEQGTWGTNGVGGSFVVRSYTQMGEQDQVTVEYQGRTQTLSTKSPKVAVQGRGGPANGAAAAPGGGGGNIVPAGRGAGGPGGGGVAPGGGGGPGGRGGGGPGGGGANGGFAGGQGGQGGGRGGGGAGGAPNGGFGAAGGQAGGQNATPISDNQKASLSNAVQQLQQNRANSLTNPSAVTPITPTAPAAGGRGGGARGGGGN